MADEYVLCSGRVLTDPMMVRLMEQINELSPFSNPDYSWDESGIATLMCDLFSDSLRYCPQSGRWYLWNKAWRKQGDSGAVMDMLQTVLNLLNLYVPELRAAAENSGASEEVYKRIDEYSRFVSRLRNLNPMKHILELMTITPDIRMNLTDMDKDPYLLNTPDGAFNLRTGRRVKSAELREACVTKMTTVSLPREGAPLCKRWYEFIDEITGGDREKARFLQRALGYSILGVNREECMFVAYGAKTRNGKGTLFSTIEKILGPDYADSAAPDLICEMHNGKTTDFNAPQPALAKLVGVRLVNMSESPRDVRLNAAAMKTMTGRDTLVTRDLYASSFSFVPQFTLWLNTNHLPAVTDDTVFTSSRVWVITFDQTFGPGSNRQDKDLKEIFQDPANAPTILRWLYDGCREYLKRGSLDVPECVHAAVQAYHDEHDRLGRFLRDGYTITGSDSDTILRGDLYAAYCTWCAASDNRFRPMGSTSFYAELSRRELYAYQHHDGGWHIHGIKPGKDEAQQHKLLPQNDKPVVRGRIKLV